MKTNKPRESFSGVAEQKSLHGQIEEPQVLVGQLTAPKELYGTITPAGPQGEPGLGLPAGGTTGQILQKLSDNDYDTGWRVAGDSITVNHLVADETGNINLDAEHIMISTPSEITVKQNLDSLQDQIGNKSYNTLVDLPIANGVQFKGDIVIIMDGGIV